MAVVCRVPVAVVHIVDVVIVGNRHMPAALAVRVSMADVLMMAVALALVRVPFVATVQMAVVHKIDVIVVGNGHVPAAFAVHVIMSGVGPVLKGCRHAAHLHRFGPLHRRSGDFLPVRHFYLRSKECHRRHAPANGLPTATENDNDFHDRQLKDSTDFARKHPRRQRRSGNHFQLFNTAGHDAP